MPKRDKRLEKARNNLKDVGFLSLLVILKAEGFDIRSGGHYIVTYPGKPGGLTIPRRNPVKTVYVEKALELIDEVRDQEER